MPTKEEMQQIIYEDYVSHQELEKKEDKRFKDCKIRSSVDELFCLNDEPHNCPLV